MKHNRKISIHADGIALLCIWYAIDPLHLFGAVLLSICLHELGHLIALRAEGVTIYGFQITALGCSIATKAMDYKAEQHCALAGPMVNLLLFSLLLTQYPKFALVNLLFAVFNLLPLWPLDGGRFLRASLQSSLSLHTAARIEQALTFLCCTLLCGLAVYATCWLHLGLWPVGLVALLLLKTGKTLQAEKFVAKRPGSRYNKSNY